MSSTSVCRESSEWKSRCCAFARECWGSMQWFLWFSFIASTSKQKQQKENQNATLQFDQWRTCWVRHLAPKATENVWINSEQKPNLQNKAEKVLKEGRSKQKTAQPKKTRKIKSTEEKRTEDTGSNEVCVYCSDLGSTEWVRCHKCSKWAHCECAGIDDTDFNFICELCEWTDNMHCAWYGSLLSVSVFHLL